MSKKKEYTPDELTAFLNFDAAQARELEPPPRMDNEELIDILEQIQDNAKSLDTTKDFVNRSITRRTISKRVQAHLEFKGFKISDADQYGYSISWKLPDSQLGDDWRRY
jgi:biotin operon repressor